MDISFVRGGGLYTECALIKGYIRNNQKIRIMAEV